jgi:hypothetical protein
MILRPFIQSSRYFSVLSAIGALLVTSLMSACATGTLIQKYKYSGVKSIANIAVVQTGDTIDRYATMVAYFRLGNPVDEISISISAEYVADITGAKKIKKTYFIVEKIVDMSKYKYRDMKYLYAEIGRNFDADWNREKDIVIVSNKTVPFKNLDEKSIYRIRYTTFSTEATDYVITIGANCEVTFIDSVE